MVITKAIIEAVFKQFIADEIVTSFRFFESGHINNTIYVKTDKNEYVLQQVNKDVFNKFTQVIENKVNVSLDFKSKPNNNYQYIKYFKTNQNSYHYEFENTIWCLMSFIKDSKTYAVLPNLEVAFEAGKLFGNFVETLSNSSTNYNVIIEDFHSVAFRFSQFKAALEICDKNIKTTYNKEISFCFDVLKQCSVLETQLTNKSIPWRITHNDTKLSNVLFSEENKGLAVIDTDTVMPGCIAFDFGDAVRTICSTAQEDETNLDKVTLNKAALSEFSKGYALETKQWLTKAEQESLAYGVITLPYLMGIRFFTDFLLGNKYYKVKHEFHNLERARNQFKLVEDIQKSFIEIQTIIKNNF